MSREAELYPILGEEDLSYGVHVPETIQPIEEVSMTDYLMSLTDHLIELGEYDE